MKTEDRVKMIIGEQAVTIAVLQAELEEAQVRIVELAKAAEKPAE